MGWNQVMERLAFRMTCNKCNLEQFCRTIYGAQIVADVHEGLNHLHYVAIEQADGKEEEKEVVTAQ